MAHANGEGSVYKRMRNGRHVGYVGALSYTQDGKPARIRLYGATRAEVRAKLKEARDRIDGGAPPRDSTRTVGDWLAHWRSTTLAASDRKPSTRELYANLSRKHLEPAPFGAITLDQLRPTDIEALVLALQDKKLSDSTIRSTYTVARAGLDGAVRDGLLARNPAEAVKRPGLKRKEARHLEADEVRRLLATLAGHRYHLALILIAFSGLRRGEALALRWSDLDLDAGMLKVAGTLGRVNRSLSISEPKTAKSRRVVPLSGDVVALLRKHRTEQKRQRLAAANQWTDTGLVFTTELGTPVEPRNLLRVAQSAAAKAGLADVDIHILRHSTATAMMNDGVPLKTVADLLGHSSISITGDIYGHTSDDAARAAVDGLAAVFGVDS